MADNIPAQPEGSVRIVLELESNESRLDNVLLQALRNQAEAGEYKDISRTKFKELFNSGKIMIKGQRARPSSALARGTTYVDIIK